MYGSNVDIHKIMYNIIMKEYRKTQTTVSLINYHFIFCPRYRRKIFDIQYVEIRFKEIIKEICRRTKKQYIIDSRNNMKL